MNNSAYNYIRKNKKDLIFMVSIVLLFWIGSIVQSFFEESNKNFIKKDYVVTAGMFESFRKVGAENHPYLTYKYKVEGKAYYRTIWPKKNPYYCEDNNCEGKIWFVIYSKEKPQKSLIDFSSAYSSDLLEIFDFSNFE